MNLTNLQKKPCTIGNSLNFSHQWCCGERECAVRTRFAAKYHYRNRFSTIIRTNFGLMDVQNLYNATIKKGENMKNIRFYVALALILVIVVIAQGGAGAWVNKLQSDPSGSVSAVAEAGNVRPQGSANGTSSVPVPPAPTCTLIATYCLATTGNLVAEALTELPAGIPIPEGQNIVITRIIQISSPDTTITKSTDDILFTLIPALASNELVSYWDGSQWVKLTIDPVLNKYVIPAGVELPLTIAVFTVAP
jgi:hypothetical protein